MFSEEKRIKEHHETYQSDVHESITITISRNCHNNFFIASSLSHIHYSDMYVRM